MKQVETIQLARVIRDACIQEALSAYENAGISGLCAEGRWECAIGALRQLDLEALVQDLARRNPDPQTASGDHAAQDP